MHNVILDGDRAIRNTPYFDYTRSKVGTRTIRVVCDNDASGQEGGELKDLKNLITKGTNYETNK